MTLFLPLWYNPFEVKNMEIEYPKRHSEAEIESSLWFRLRQLKLDARLQVKTIKSKLDVVVFKDSKAVCIVECKSWTKQYHLKQRYQRAKNNKQITKYKELFGIPVYICGYFSAIEPLSKIILDLYQKS